MWRRKLQGQWQLVWSGMKPSWWVQQGEMLGRRLHPSLSIPLLPVPGVHEHPMYFMACRNPQHFGKLLQHRHHSHCLAALKLSTRWVSRDQQLPPVPKHVLPFPLSQPLSPSCVLD